MRYDDNGYSRLIYQTEHIHYFRRHFGVDIARRLVGDYHFRVVDNSSGKRDTLLLAARKLCGKRFFLAGKSDYLHNRGNALFDFFSASSDGAHRKCDVIKNVHCRNKSEILKNDAETSSEFGNLSVCQIFCINSVDNHFAARRNVLCRQQADDGRFSRAGMTVDENKFAVINAQADPFERRCAVFMSYGNGLQIYHFLLLFYAKETYPRDCFITYIQTKTYPILSRRRYRP